MTDFEWFSSAHYQFLHSPEVATLRAHYDRNGFPYFDKHIDKENDICTFYDVDNKLMFSVSAENLIQLYTKTDKMISASMQ